METKKNKLETDIAYTNKLLSQNTKSKKVSLRQLSLIRLKIKQRKKLITTLNTEINHLSKNIRKNNNRIKELKLQLAELKDSYGKMIYSTFKNRNSLNRLMFIFSAENFNQAYKRTKYFQQYSKHRRKQATQIVATKDSVDKINNLLEFQKTEKVQLKVKEEKEKGELEKEKKHKDSTLKKLSKKEKSLKKQLKNKERAARKLQNAIQNLIEKEIRLSAKKAGKTEKEIRAERKFTLTPEEQKLSDGFVSNKGKLPWPVEKGVISEYYGEHSYPGLRLVKTHNNGIDLMTEKGQEARAVFSGKVSNILSIPNMKNVVMVRHGEYLTIYSHLEHVYVSEGDIINTKDRIGKIYTDKDSGETEIHFELWKGKTRQNPSNWLAK